MAEAPITPGALVQGTNVHLRHLRAQDEQEWVELRRASRAFLEPWDPEPREGDDPYGPGGFARSLATGNTETNQRHVIVRARDRAIVGMVNLSQIHRWPFFNAIMGYWIAEPFTRRGYGREGVALCLERVFGDLGLHRVEANVMPENAPSLALVRSLGFREEGFSPRYLQIAGAWRDHTRWAMIREDWESRGSN